MRGHIRKRGVSSWAIILDVGLDDKGSRKQKWHSVKGTKKDAEKELTRLLNELNLGSYVEPTKLLLSEHLENWLNSHGNNRVTPKTKERYEEIINKHIKPKLGHHLISKLQPLHIQAFYDELVVSGRLDGKGGLSPRSVLHIHRILRKALSQAVKLQVCARNVADAVEAPKPEDVEMKYLNTSEIATLLKLVKGTDLYIPVLVAVTTGMRRGELLALKWRDINFTKNTISIRQSLEQTKEGLRFKQPKTKKSRRTIPISPMVVKALKSHKLEQAKQRLAIGPAYNNIDMVYSKLNGSCFLPSSLSSKFSAFRRMTNLPAIRFHDLRHTHATELFKQGVHPKIVSERLGHSSVVITLTTYSHVLPGMQDDAIASFDTALLVEMNKKTEL